VIAGIHIIDMKAKRGHIQNVSWKLQTK
jgi:hypothetical protein